MIQQVYEKKEKQNIVRTILEALPDWFGISSAREEYIAESALQTLFAVFDGSKPVGFLCLKETGKDTVELLVMGVLKEYQNLGFKEFEVFPELWDEWNPCQVYVMSL